jgi:hypothetical protein
MGVKPKEAAMPTVLDRPEVIEQRPPALQPPERRKGVRGFRWLGWLLLAGTVVLIGVLAINATSDDGVVETPVSYADFMGEATVTPDPGSRLVEHAPGFVEHPVTSFMEEATVTPGLIVMDGGSAVVEPAPRTSVQPPVTEFMEEATVTPDLGSRLVEHAPGSVEAPVADWLDEATVTPR